MRRLTYPISRDGLVADILINLELRQLVPLRLNGGGPAPITGRALVDTGSDVTSVALPILKQLGTMPFSQVTTHSFSGPIVVDLYRVSFHLYEAANSQSPWFSQGSLIVMEMAAALPFDAIIGLDILRQCRTTIDGPAGAFTFEF